MKLLNILKKVTSKEVNSNIQKMDKKQLSKVIGGSDIVGAAAIGGAVSKTTIPVGGTVVVGTTTASGL